MTVSPSTTDIPNRQQSITAAPLRFREQDQSYALARVMGGNPLKPGDFVWWVLILISAVVAQGATTALEHAADPPAEAVDTTTEAPRFGVSGSWWRGLVNRADTRPAADAGRWIRRRASGRRDASMPTHSTRICSNRICGVTGTGGTLTLRT